MLIFYFIFFFFGGGGAIRIPNQKETGGHLISKFDIAIFLGFMQISTNFGT